MSMKYIQLDYAGYIIFDKGQKHSDVAKKYPSDTVLSAGFVEIYGEDKEVISCRGESSSLNVKSKEIDSEIMFRRLSVYN